MISVALATNETLACGATNGTSVPLATTATAHTLLMHDVQYMPHPLPLVLALVPACAEDAEAEAEAEAEAVRVVVGQLHAVGMIGTLADCAPYCV